MSMRPYAEYRSTGNRWLAAIPKHWVLAKCGHHYEVLLGKMLDASRVTGMNPGRYLRNVDVQWDGISEDDLPEMDFAPSEGIALASMDVGWKYMHIKRFTGSYIYLWMN